MKTLYLESINSPAEGLKSADDDKSLPLLLNSSASTLKALRLPLNIFFDPLKSSVDGEKGALIFLALCVLTRAVAGSEFKAKTRIANRQSIAFFLFI